MKHERILSLLAAVALFAAGCASCDSSDDGVATAAKSAGKSGPAAAGKAGKTGSTGASAAAGKTAAAKPARAPDDGLAWRIPAAVRPGDTLQLPVYGAATVVDVVECAGDGHRFADWPAGASRVAKVLGKPCRVMDVQEDRASYLDWRLGEGKGLKPNGAYAVLVEYPDDVPRAYHVRNYGNNSRRSFYTGRSNGDACEGPIVHHKPESLDIPQSGEFRTWSSLTFLGEKASNRRDLGKEDAEKAGEKHQMDIATDGFEIAFSQYKRPWHPASEGIAVSRILLCEIKDEKAAWARIPFPPKGLPRRHIFWREEMSNVTGDGSLCPGNGGLDWWEQKMRAMKIFAQNAFCKDLLEFGHCKQWDVDWKKRNNLPGARPSGWMWGGNGGHWDVWGRIVPKAVDEYGFEMIPYYEYGGAAGDGQRLGPTLGQQKRAEPLDLDNKPDQRGKNYTHIWWSEGKLRVDITDPDTLAELEYILDCTVLRFKEQVEKGGFLGVVMRPRPGQWAISFSDATRARFAEEENGGKPVSRADLKSDKALYDRYIAWYGKRRAQFMDDIRGYLEDNGVKNAFAILENDASETGYPLKDGGIMTTDDLAFWQAKLPEKAAKIVDVNDPSVVGRHRYLQALKTPTSTWGCWEWQHASPFCDPEHYKGLRNVWIALPFHALFTATDPDCFQAFANANGTETIIRHYDLNEGTFDSDELRDPAGNPIKNDKGEVKKSAITGYAMADWEHAGRACMIAEVNAMANGDPETIGYLMGSNYTRGFPGPVVEFNRNFLALPALPSKKLDGAADAKDVTVRLIDCSAKGAGRYFAVVHTGYTGKKGVKIRLPADIKALTDIDGQRYAVKDGVATIPELLPWQLLTLRAK